MPYKDRLKQLEYQRLYQRTYRKTHRAECKAANRLYKIRHKDTVNAYSKVFMRQVSMKRKIAGLPSLTVLWKRNLRESQPERYSMMRRKYRHDRRTKIRDGSITSSFLFELSAVITHCPYCRRLIDVGQKTIDHVIPLRRGGSHTQGNVVICCRQCNLSKCTKLLTEWQSPYQYQGAGGMV